MKRITTILSALVMVMLMGIAAERTRRIHLSVVKLRMAAT